MAASRQTYIHTYTRDLQCSHASVRLAQAHPNQDVLVVGCPHLLQIGRKLPFCQLLFASSPQFRQILYFMEKTPHLLPFAMNTIAELKNQLLC